LYSENFTGAGNLNSAHGDQKILYSKDFSQKSLDFFETLLYISQGVKQSGGGGND